MEDRNKKMEDRKIFPILIFVKLILLINIKSMHACEPPSGCRINPLDMLKNHFAHQLFSPSDFKSVQCMIDKSEYKFEFDSWLAAVEKKSSKNCSWSNYIELRFAKKRNIILGPRFGLQGVIEFMLRDHHEITFRFTHLNGFEIDLGIDLHSESSRHFLESVRYELEFINTRFDFYTNGRLIKRSCDDMSINESKSIFQVNANQQTSLIKFINCEFKRAWCPLVFQNARIREIGVFGACDNYLKRNILTFSNHTFENLNSTINRLIFYSSENIAITSKLLNPHVFKTIRVFASYNGYREIQDEVFATFNNLRIVQLEAIDWKPLVHKQGIKWISSINSHINIDPSNREEIMNNSQYSSEIGLRILYAKKIVDFFPEEDFCVYKDYPFHQLVFFRLYFEETGGLTLSWRGLNLTEWEYKEITCTFRFATQYHEYFSSIVYDIAYDPSKHSCDFEHRLKLCVKSTFTFKFEWSIDNSFELNILFQIILTISSYVISFLGVFTNSVVLVIILKKDNSDLFKQLNQYKYLCLISVFNIIILLIHLISWLSDCNAVGVIDVFCPFTRKYVAIQFFKVIFKEALVVALRFMSNFAYMAFAFNRVSLIGKDHPKLVEYMSKVKIKKYFLVTAIVSVLLSVVKGFKYQINYDDHPELNYPMSFEYDLWFSKSTDSVGKSVYMVINFVSDFLNYLVFLVFHLIIDVYMLLRLRTTLNEKSKRLTDLKTNLVVIDSVLNKENIESINSKANKKDFDINDVMNNAIKMVVWNSVLSVLLKCLLLFIPLINTITIFYYHSEAYKSGRKRGYDTFFNLFNGHGFFFMLPILADSLYIVFISIQLFVYVRFDKKIKTGFDRLFNRSI